MANSRKHREQFAAQAFDLARASLFPTRRLYIAAMILLVVLLVGAAGYRVIGDGQWSWTECLYMTGITISTVGFSEALPGMKDVPLAREWTLLMIVSGSGSLLYFASMLTAFIVEGDLRGVLRRQRMQQKINALTEHYVVCGCGDTGIHVTSQLLRKGTPFVVIERDADRIRWVQEELKREFLYIVGDATDDDTLEQAGIRRARGLVSSLHDDPENLYVTITARSLNRDLRIVVKALDPDAKEKMLRAGANQVVLTHLIGGHRLVTEVTSPDVTEFLDLMMREDEVPHEIVEYRLTGKSKWIGCQIKEVPLRKQANALILALRHPGGEFEYNPPPDRVLKVGMTLILLANAEALRNL